MCAMSGTVRPEALGCSYKLGLVVLKAKPMLAVRNGCCLERNKVGAYNRIGVLARPHLACLHMCTLQLHKQHSTSWNAASGSAKSNAQHCFTEQVVLEAAESGSTCHLAPEVPLAADSMWPSSVRKAR